MHTVEFYGFLLAAGLLVWTLGVYSKRVKAYVAPPLLIMLAGIGLRWLMPQPENFLLDYLETLSWLGVGFGVTGIALRLTGQDIRRLWKPGAIITGAGMVGMWGLSTLLVWWCLEVPFIFASLIGAILTPTDPVIASSIVTGPFAEKHIPKRLRHMLSFESGANDGLGFAFVFLPILLIQKDDAAWSEWFLRILGWKVIAAGALGAFAGWVAGKTYNLARKEENVEAEETLLASITLTITILAGMKMLSVDSIWAVFAAALVFTSLLPGDAREAADAYQEGGVYLTMVPALLIFGMALPWSRWESYGLRIVLAVIALLLLRRLPVIAFLYRLLRRRDLAASADGDRNPYHTRRDWLFYGWFGPIGLSAVYYATTAQRHLHDERIWAIASMAVFSSIVVHGLTSSPFSRWYKRWDRA